MSVSGTSRSSAARQLARVALLGAAGVQAACGDNRTSTYMKAVEENHVVIATPTRDVVLEEEEVCVPRGRSQGDDLWMPGKLESAMRTDINAATQGNDAGVPAQDVSAPCIALIGPRERIDPASACSIGVPLTPEQVDIRDRYRHLAADARAALCR